MNERKNNGDSNSVAKPSTESDQAHPTLTPTFAAGTYAYAAPVASTVAEVTLTPTLSDTTATIEYLDASDMTLDDEDTSVTGQQVALALGDNVIKVKVTAEDGTTTQTYTVTVNREAIPPTIDSVAVTSTPRAAPDTYGAGETIEISVTFNEAVTATTGTDFLLAVAGYKRAPLLRGSGTEILVFGYLVQAGDSNALGISIGPSYRTLDGDRNGYPQTGAITSVATAEAADLAHGSRGTLSGHKVDGSLTPHASTDATLSGLAVNDGSTDLTLSPVFASGTTSYTASVANEVAEVTVTPTQTDTTATIEYLDASDMTLDDAGTAPGQQVALAGGDNVIKVKVTAEDGTTTQTYTVTINLTDVDDSPPTPTPTEPDAPTSLRSTRGDQRVTLRWTAPASDGGESITDYEYEQDGSRTWTSTGGTATRYTVTGLTNGQTYTFRVRAVNSLGASGESNEATATPSTDPDPEAVGPPSPPRDLTAMAGDQAVQLSWRRPADDGGARIVRYEYRQQEGDGPVGEWQIIREDPPHTDHQVSGLTNGVSYTFQVRAVNRRRASPPSAPARATPEPELEPFEVAIVGVPDVAVAGESYELTAQSDEASLVYAWRVAWGGTIERDDAQMVVWTAPETAVVAWIRVDATREEDGATAGQSAYVRVEVPDPEPEPEPVPALPVAGAIGLALLLLGTGGRALRGRARG